MRQERQAPPTGRESLIALGSNGFPDISDAAEAIQKASLRCAELFGATVRCSRIYRTPAFPEGSGPDFANACLALRSDLPAAEILQKLHRIEAEAGRVRDRRWGARTLDLDLIAAGEEVAPDEETLRHWIDLPLERQVRDAPDRLILPHPRVQDRSFVLIPLLDIAPDWRHPVLGLTVRQMAAARPEDERAGVRPLPGAVSGLVNPPHCE